ncbi:hypothetical protein PUN28_004813 [Cardiocondyla obscurior]|uniref:Uncharacterized protein n=1 Tax=Cardiocondyla obscurior TaxID=286306 RepID=A0AAW2GFF1_9HYME
MRQTVDGIYGYTGKDVTTTYVAVPERVAPYCSRWRGEESDEEGIRARVSRRRKGCAEGWRRHDGGQRRPRNLAGVKLN